MNELSGFRDESSRTVWRLVSIVGVVVTLLVALAQSFPLEPRQNRSFLVLVLMAIAVLVAMRFVFAFAWQTLRAKPDLLVPVGVVLFASAAIDWLLAVPIIGSLFASSWPARLAGLSLNISLGMVLQIVAWTAYAAWQTDLLWRWLRDRELPSLSPWGGVRVGFWRTLVTLSIGVGVLLAALIPAIALGAAAMPLALLAMGAISVLWNLLTAALLPVSLMESGPLVADLKTGFRRSWQLKHRWWLHLTVHLLLLGIVVFVTVGYTAKATDPITRTTSVTQTRNVSFNVNAFWVGGYNKLRQSNERRSN